MKQSLKFKITDILLIIGAILPIVGAIVLKVLYTPVSEDLISVHGALIFLRFPMPFGGDLLITEAQVNSWAVIIQVFFLALWFTHGLKLYPGSKRQIVAEMAVEACNKLVGENMGQYFSGYPAFIGAIMLLSVLSSFLTLVGLFPPTSDVNVIAGWGVLVFILITYYKLKGGVLNYLKGFTEPIFVMTPMNILGEIATPVSMTFRHFGNVLSGSVISVLLAAGLTKLSAFLLGWLPSPFGTFPLFRIGIPGVLSLYFDLFSSSLQAFIFAMLTMLNISTALPVDKWLEKKDKKEKRKAARESKKISRSGNA